MADYKENETEFIDEDDRLDVIKNLTDDEEIDAALELIKEKFDEPEMDTSSKEETSEPEKDTSEEEKQDEGERESSEGVLRDIPSEEEETAEEETFVLSDKIIENQPEEYRKILNKYRGKNKEELAFAAANAIAMKNPYLRDNEEAIQAIAKKISSQSDEEVLKTLIETQAKTGLPVTEGEEKIKTSPKIEFSEVPENEMKEIIDRETVKRLKKKYPDMPEDMTSEEYREWERALFDEGGYKKVNEFLRDLENTTSEIKNEFQKVLYAQVHLKNLYNETPAELLPILNEKTLPKLKELNDNFREVNNRALEEEVKMIREELKKYGIEEKDLGVDLNLEKDENGSYYNETLNSLMLNGNEVDNNVIGRIGKVPFLKKGQLAKKFIYENNAKILTTLVNNKIKKDKQTIEKLKDENLKTLGHSKGTSKSIDFDDIRKITDDEQLDKILESIRNKY
ncbi:MAG: hypothetical protein QXD05_00240 [Candidatus Pacearchaeota archaeon]